MKKIRNMLLKFAIACAVIMSVAALTAGPAHAVCVTDPLNYFGCHWIYPDPPPGTMNCQNATPGVAQIYIYSGVNYTGTCVAISPIKDIPNLYNYGWGYPNGDTGFWIKSIKTGPLMPGTGWHAFYSHANYGGAISYNVGNQPDTSQWWIRSLKAH